MKNTLKIGFLAIMFAFVFVACKPKAAEEAVDAAAEEVVAEEVVEETPVDTTAAPADSTTVVAE